MSAAQDNLFLKGFTLLNPTKSVLCLRRSNLAGFTLIELLVVIVIITILASVLLITFKGVDEKAKLTNLIQFSQSQRTAFFNELVGWWPFDELVAEGASTTTIDNSFQRNRSVVQGGVKVAKGIINSALEFNGVDGYVDCGNGASLNISGPLTVEAWIKVNKLPISGEGLASKTDLAYGLTYYTNGHVYAYVAGGGICHVSTPVDLDVWTHVAQVFDGLKNRLYKNGKEVASRNCVSSPASSANFKIGFQGGYFNGLIDEVQIYNVALPLAVIQQHYAEGLKRHQNLAQR